MPANRTHRTVVAGSHTQPPRRAPQLRSHLLFSSRCSLALVVLTLAGLPACTLTPEGTDAEQSKLQEAGKPYEPKLEDRVLPDLPDAPVWQDVLRRAFLANGDLESAYFNWKAAVERIQVDSAYPNTNISLGFDYMFSKENMKSFDRSTFTAGFDPSMTLVLPVKVQAAAKLALSEARLAGEKFRVAKFELQRTVLRTWADYTLQQRLIALRTEDVALRRIMAQAAVASAGAGKRVREAKAADLELRTSESELLDLKSAHETTRAKLNALMARPPNSPLKAPTSHPELRSLPDDDSVLLGVAADIFPEVAAMAREVEGRSDALEVARLRWIPDFSPTAGFTGSISQAVGAMVMLPTNIAGISGQIRVAEAYVRASQATLRQRSADRVGEYVSLLVMYRNAQRQLTLFESSLLPASQRLIDDQTRAYEAGAAMFGEVLESRRLSLKINEMIAAARAEMDKAIVEIECCLGLDIETVAAVKQGPAIATTVATAGEPSTQSTSANPSAPAAAQSGPGHSTAVKPQEIRHDH